MKTKIIKQTRTTILLGSILVMILSCQKDELEDLDPPIVEQEPVPTPLIVNEDCFPFEGRYILKYYVYTNETIAIWDTIPYEHSYIVSGSLELDIYGRIKRSGTGKSYDFGNYSWSCGESEESHWVYSSGTRVYDYEIINDSLLGYNNGDYTLRYYSTMLVDSMRVDSIQTLGYSLYGLQVELRYIRDEFFTLN